MKEHEYKCGSHAEAVLLATLAKKAGWSVPAITAPYWEEYLNIRFQLMDKSIYGERHSYPDDVIKLPGNIDDVIRFINDPPKVVQVRLCADYTACVMPDYPDEVYVGCQAFKAESIKAIADAMGLIPVPGRPAWFPYVEKTLENILDSVTDEEELSLELIHNVRQSLVMMRGNPPPPSTEPPPQPIEPPSETAMAHDDDGPRDKVRSNVMPAPESAEELPI
jgi:hypothetical protein